ncbi:hypothetical protein J6590_101606 [Homalodisca vitripennis]|nr:hypothetical protein J6590_101606 [Homalodisca vitripennis]
MDVLSTLSKAKLSTFLIPYLSGVAKGGLRGRAAPGVTSFGVTPTQLTKADKRNLATQG